MTPRTLLIPATVALTLGLTAGTASANANTVDANCDGLTFNMPRTEEGTVVTATLDGRTVRTVTNDTFGAPVAFTIGSPDQTVSHTWSVTVDSVYNTDQFWTETVPACVTPSTTTTPTTSTTVPVTSPTVVTTTTVAPSTTLVTTPRTPSSTTTTVGSTVPTFLPATGPATSTKALALLAGLAVAWGAVCLWIIRGGAR
jgi:hypothetical protein